MVKLRKGPACRGKLGDGTPCGARVERAGECCHVCLERLATTADVASRRELAQAADLPVQLFLLLGSDPDDDVRRILARRADCPLVVLQHLEQDGDPEVRAAATSALSTALSPRLLQQSGNQGLFTRAEVEAFGQPDADPGDGAVRELSSAPATSYAPDEPDPVNVTRRLGRSDPADRIRRVNPAPVMEPALAAGFGDVLARLEALGDRMTALEAVLSSAGERLGSISDRLEELAEVGPVPAARHRGAGAGSVAGTAPAAANGLLPARCAAELGTGPVIRADVVAVAWLSVIPLLARRRGPGLRLLPASVAGEPVAGPLLPSRAPAVAELRAASPGPDARRGGGPAAEEPLVDLPMAELSDLELSGVAPSAGPWPLRSPKHRRHAVHAKRR